MLKYILLIAIPFMALAHVNAQSVTVTAPNGGQTLYSGKNTNITWTHSGISSFVKLEYSPDSGSNWILIAGGVNNTGSYAWSVPANVSENCLVRVSDFSNSAISDVSDGVFTIRQPFITITSPNGGETYEGCSQQAIIWTFGGVNTYARISYSTDGGLIWTPIAEPYVGNGSSYSYNWSVPSIQTGNFKIRVTDYYDSGIWDETDAVFTVTRPASYLTLTSPNGGESWSSSSTKTITWNTTGTVGNVSLKYSTNGGASWDWVRNSTGNAANNVANTGSYQWLVPAGQSATSCLVQIYEYAKPCNIDMSNSLFLIDNNPAITVTAPKGGEKYFTDRNYSISWSASNLPTNYVAIDYSTDNGATWIAIVTSQSNNGSYSWKIPNTPSTQCLVRVKARDNHAISAVSEGNFTIATPYIRITSPAGGEVLTGCNTHQITWEHEGLQSYARIFYSTDGGANWIHVADPYILNTNSYNWTVPSVASGQVKLKMEDYYNSNVAAVSQNFTVALGADYLTLTAPNGGEAWAASSVQTITWNTTGTVGNVSIKYSTNGGASWDWVRNTADTAASNIANTGSFEWLLPSGVVSSNCLLQVYQNNKTCIIDFSDNAFTIDNSPAITVTSPKLNDKFFVARSYTISWSASNLPTNFVAIDYSTDNGASWNSIVTSQSNNGSRSWTVPDAVSEQCIIRVSARDDATIFGLSQVFTIAAPYIRITSPAGGEVLTGCNTHQITWEQEGLQSYARIFYSIDGGNNWIHVADPYIVNTNSYNWTVPSVASGQVKLKMEDYYNSNVAAVSQNFTVALGADYLTLTAPNGGEAWAASSVQTITWNTTGTVGNVSIKYSTNGGASWDWVRNTAGTAASNIANSGSFEWLLPSGVVSANCLLQVYQNNKTCIIDFSDNAFTIDNSPAITVTSPKLNDKYFVARSYTISWSASNLPTNFVAIDYSTDNGASWNSIVTSQSNNGSRSWTIPDAVSEQCIIRVSARDDATIFGLSQVFTIAAPYIRITSPVGGEVWPGCTQNQITWEQEGLQSYARIFYSIDGGNNWIHVADPYIVNTNSYNWTIPSVASSQFRVKVEDYYNNKVKDSSDTNFTVTQGAVYLTLTSPNGLETFSSSTLQNITWNTTGTIGNVSIRYSTNGGATWDWVRNNAGTAASNIPNTGSFEWLLPSSLISSKCMIQIYENSNTCRIDYSDDFFTINNDPVITVTAPAPGETYYYGETKTIRWSASNLPVNTVKIEYTLGNGAWQVIRESQSNNGSYNWVVPATASAAAYIRISSTSDAAIYDTNNSPFIIKAPVIRVTNPNTGNENWLVGENKNISWTTTGLPGTALVNIAFSANNGETWSSIAESVANSGSYIWTVPNIATSSRCLIKVTSVLYPESSDVNDFPFTITRPVFGITVPNDGQVWYIGESKSIQWAGMGTTGNVKLELSTDGGENYSTIIASTANTGQYFWAIPYTTTPSANSYIKVTDLLDATNTDSSDVPFTIAKPILTLTAPNTAETWYLGQTKRISWTNTGMSNAKVRIEYSHDGGTTWAQVALVNNSGQYDWVIPSTTAQSENAFIRISDENDVSINDVNDVPFRMVKPSITITSPNGGEVLFVGQVKAITWNRDGAYSPNVKIEYTADGGALWQVIAESTVNNGTFNWTLPASLVTGNNYLVKVSDAVDPTITDQSNAAFTVNSPSLTVTTPNGGEVFYAGITNTIRWTSQGLGSSRKLSISLSPDNGTSWNVIANDVNNSGAYSWPTPPETGAGSYLVKINDILDPAIADVSNSPFTISKPTITVTSPNGGEKWYNSQVKQIKWSSTALSSSGSVKLEYSVNNGAAWTEIAASVLNSGSYNWTVPASIITTQALVRVTSLVQTSVSDVSNNPFSIGEPRTGDEFETAKTIASLPHTLSDTTSFYSDKFSGIGNQPAGDVFYSFTVPAVSDSVSFTVVANYQALLHVLASKTSVLGTSAPGSSVKYGLRNLVPGQTYYIVVEGTNTNAGNFTLTVNNHLPAPDLSVQAVTADKTTINPGDAVTIQWNIANVGRGSSVINWNERLYIQSANGANRTLLRQAVFSNTDMLAPNQVLPRSQEVTMPAQLNIGEEGVFVVEIVPSAAVQEVPGATANNIAVQQTPWSISKLLVLELSPAEITEGAAGTTAKISRTGSLTDPVVVTVTPDSPARFTFPAQVTIPAGKASATFTVAAINNDLIEGTLQDVLRVSATGFPAATATITILDNDKPTLAFANLPADAMEGTSVSFRVTTNLAPAQPLQVFLTSGSQTRFPLPPSVTIPAGSLFTEVTVNLDQDNIPEVDLSVNLNAGAAGHTPASASILVKDDDVPGLELVIHTTSVAESGGPYATQATLRRTTTNNPVAFTANLSASLPNTLILPASIPLAANENEKTFTIGVVDNTLAEGDRAVTVTAAVFVNSCGCNAPATSSGYVTASLTVTDNDGPAITLSASQLTLAEGFATAGQLRITRNTPPDAPLTVNLTSSDVNEATVPATAVIPAGQTFVEIPITTINDGVSDGNKQVYFHASAEGFSTGSVWVMVSDRNIPDLQIAATSVSAAEVQAQALFNYRVTVKNSGFATAPTGVFVYAYLSKDDIIDATDELLAQDEIMTSIPAGQTVNVQNAVKAPNMPGNYKLLFWVNPESSMTELLLSNNQSAPLAFKINPDYTATANVSNDYFLKGQPVLVTGTATRFDGTIAANKEVEVYVITNGIRRTVKATTDASGNYSSQFIPLANEAGSYAVGASFPGMGATTPQDNFDILGVRINNGQVPQLRVVLGDTLKGSVSVKNMSNRSLTSFTLAPQTLPDGAKISFGTLTALAGNATANLAYTVTGTTLSSGSYYEVAKMNAVSGEGTLQSQELDYYCQAPNAHLVADVNRLDVTASASKGERIIELRIRNQGAGATGAVSVSLPQVNWLTAVTPKTLPSLASGDTTLVILKFSALAEVPFDYPIKGSIAVNSQNGPSLTIPFTFEKKSETAGNLAVSVTNQFTFYAEGAPKVAGARVLVKNYFTGALYAEGVTDATGVFTAAGIPEGRHRLIVEKEKHQPYNGTININPGGDTETSVFLSYQAITFSWSVVPTAIEDEYDITLVTTFETHIPMPVVTIDMPKEMPQLSGSEVFAFNVTLTNHGLITAESVQLTLPQNDPEYEFITNYQPADLLAQQSIQVPAIMRRRASAIGGEPLAAGGASIQAVSEFLGMEASQYSIAAAAQSVICRDFAYVLYTYKCSLSTGMWQRTGFDIKFSGRTCSGPVQGPPGEVWIIEEGPGGRGGGKIREIVFGPGSGGGSGETPEYDTEVKSCIDCIKDMFKVVWDCRTLVGKSKAKAGAKKRSKASTKDKIDCVQSIEEAVNTCMNTQVAGSIIANGEPSLASALSQVSRDSPLGAVFLEIADKLEAAANGYRALYSLDMEYYGEIFLSDAFEDFAVLTDPSLDMGDSIRAPLQASILAAMAGYELPQSTIQAFFTRWNTSVYARSQGILAPTTQYPDMVNWTQVESYLQAIAAANNAAIAKGYQSFEEMYDKTYDDLGVMLEAQEQAVCASVKVKFSQKLTMTREAFEGTLDIYNGHPTDPMQQLSVNINITDENGVPSNGLFEIVTKSLTNLSDVTGTGAIGAQQNGLVKFLFIPEHGAAPTAPKDYNFGGSVRYFDPYAQAMVELPLADVTLTVNPSPNLMLHYFMERNILGDDALTKNVIEPSIPAELAVMVENHGYGPAVNMMISSAQPEIIENEKGLAINFQIVGSNFQGQPKKLGVTDINFGTVPPLETRIGQWYFTSSLLGKFVSYEAEVVHANSFGNPDLSLVKGIKLHELTRSIRAYGPSEDGINDFLVNDVFDIHDTPDIIYFSQGNRTAEVFTAETGSFSSGVAGPSFTNTLTVTASEPGWNYIKLNDPGNNKYDLVSITRNDGQVIPLNNGWLTFVTLPVSRPPVYENKFHFADEFASTDPVTYTVVWKPRDLNVPAVVSITGPEEPVTAEQVTQVTVKFSKSIDAATFTYEDMSLTFQGGPNIMDNTVAISQVDTSTFLLEIASLTTGNGFYNLTVQAAGVQDVYGISGASGKNLTWSQFLTVPTVQAFYGIPEGNTAAAFDTIHVLFNLPIDLETAGPERFRIFKDETLLGVLTLDSVRADNKLFYLSGLGNILTESGTYKLAVDLPNIKTKDQVAGMQEQSVRLTVDNTGPQVISLEKSVAGGLDPQHVTFVHIKFDEDAKGFNTASLKLTRNGEVLYLNIAQLSNTDLQNWSAGNFGMLTYPEGNYTLTVNSAGFTDAIGNAGTGTAQLSWTVNRSAGVAITGLAVSPDLGFSDTDGITSGLSLEVAFSLSNDAAQVTIAQTDPSGEGVLKTISGVAAGAVKVPVTLLAGGATGIRVTAAGANGGAATAEKQLFIDQAPLAAQWQQVPGQVADAQPEALQLTFSSKLLNHDNLLSAIQFSRNGVNLPLEGLSFQLLSDGVYQISGLRNAGSEPGTYQLTCNLQPFRKYSSGLAGTGWATVSWTVQPNNQAPVAHAGNDIIVTAAGIVTLDASSSHDPDSDELTYEWIAPGGITLSDPLAPNPTFAVNSSHHGKTYSFLLVVRDGTLFATATVHVKVALANPGIVLAGNVKLQGRPEAPHASWQRPVRVDIFPAGQTTPVASFSPQTDAQGAFSLSDIAITPGDYVLTVKNPHTLTHARAVSLAPGENVIGFGEMREGDANNDDNVTMPDFSILAATYNLAQGNNGYDTRADFNGDARVTLLDFSLLSGSFNQQGYVVTAGSFEELKVVQPETGGTGALLPATPVYMELVKPDRSLMTGEEISLPVLLHTEQQEIDGAEVHLAFNPDILQATLITAGSQLPVELLKLIDNENGRISFAAGTLSTLPKGDLELLRIGFKVLVNTNETPVGFTTNTPDQTAVTYRGRSVLTGTSGGTVGLTNCTGCAGKEVITYPNPTRDKFVLSLRGYKQEQGKLTIIRVDGAELLTMPVDMRKGNSLEVDISAQPTGVYLLRLELGNTSSVHRIVKY